MQLGIFTDIHFQPQGLERIVKTGDWIIEEFKRQGVQAVVCMGDALVTREIVDVVAQSAAIKFFRKLADHWPVFLTLGNHDLNLKHSTSVSSLDGLDMHPKIKVFREITLVGDRFLFIPYYEDQSKIVAWVSDYARNNQEKAKNIIVFGHLSINGAVQNTRYSTTFSGAVGPDVFAPFRSTYSGHFHVHQRMDHRVTYVGSPLQFNFGDCGDERGIMVLDTDNFQDRFILNPHYDAFRIVKAQDIEAAMPSLKDCFVTVVYDDVVSDEQHQAITAKLEAAGVLSIKQESVVDKAIREHTVDINGVQATTAIDLVEPFVKSILTADSQLNLETTVKFGKAIISEVNANFQNVDNTGSVFEGDITDIIMTNFLGVGGTVHLKVKDLNPGIWYLEGKNGHGKSTPFEAIFWCYFNENIRNEMKADDVVHDPLETGKGKDCEVSILHANGWGITRFRKNAKLGGTGVKVFKDGFYREDFEKGDPKATQKMINDLLGINAQTFIRAYIMGQNVTANFISGDEKARRAMIEEMLGLERFDAYLEKTREFKKTISDQMDQQESIQRIRAGEIERSAGQVGAIDLQITQAIQDWQAKMTQLAIDLGAHGKKVVADLAAVEQEIKDATESDRIEREKRDIVSATFSKIKDDQSGLIEKINAQNAAARDCLSMADRVKAAWRAFESSLATHNANVVDINNKIDDIQKKQVALKSLLDQESTFLETWRAAGEKEAQVAGWNTAYAAHRATAEAYTSQSVPLTTKIERLSKLTAGECPTCSHPLEKAGLDAVIGDLNKELSHLRKAWMESTSLAAAALQQAKALKDEAQRMVIGLPTVAQLEAAKVLVTTLEASVSSYMKALAVMPEARAKIDNDLRLRLATDVPGHVWPPIDGDVIAGFVTDMLKQHKIYTERAKELATQHHEQAEETRVAFMALEAASNRAKITDEALRKVQERKSILEAVGKTTEANLVKEYQELKVKDPVHDLKITKGRLVADRAKAMSEMDAARTAAVLLSQKSAYVAFWDKAFAAKGSMRAFLLDQSVQQLNTVIASYIGQHFGGRFTLTFNSDLTFKERYGRRSGGQRKWTDLACLFSLFELTRQRSRYRATYMALDEVFDALDVEGRRAVQELINTMTGRVKRLFVITHVDMPGVSRAGIIQAVMVDHATTLTVKPT